METPAPAATPAPAPVAPAPAPTVSATVDAATKGDFAAFQSAERASRTGKPAPDVEAPPAKVDTPAVEAKTETPVAPEAPKQVSKRQQQINDYERRIAEQDQRIRDLEARSTRQPQAQPAPPKTPEYKRYAAMPEAPRLDAVDAEGQPLYASLDEHAAAMALFIADQRYGEHRQREQAQTAQSQRFDHERARIDAWDQKIDAAVKADPEFIGKLSQEVISLKPVSGLAPHESRGPLNILWEHVYDSPDFAALALHFSQHPEDLRTFAQIPPEILRLPVPAHERARRHETLICQQLGALTARLTATSTPAAPPQASTSPISNAPPPPPTVQRTGVVSDPKQAALERGDFGAMQRHWRTERANQRVSA